MLLVHHRRLLSAARVVFILLGALSIAVVCVAAVMATMDSGPMVAGVGSCLSQSAFHSKTADGSGSPSSARIGRPLDVRSPVFAERLVLARPTPAAVTNSTLSPPLRA